MKDCTENRGETEGQVHSEQVNEGSLSQDKSALSAREVGQVFEWVHVNWVRGRETRLRCAGS